MAGALIGALRVSLSAETSAFEAGMKRAQRTAKTTASSIQGAFKNAIGAGITGFVSAISIGAIVAAGKAALDYAGSLGEVSQQLGVTTRDLQVFRFAAGQVGVSQSELETGLDRLTRTMGNLAAGAKAPRAALEGLKKGLADQVLAAKDTGEAFRLIADGLANIPDRAQRAAVEVALFGRSGAKLDNLLAGGSAAINELSLAAEKLGIVLSDEQIQKADETADKLDALQTVLKAQIAGVVADNSDAILGLANALVTLISKLGTALRAYQAFVAEMNVLSGKLKSLDPTNSAENRAAGRLQTAVGESQLRDLRRQQAGGSSAAERAARLRRGLGMNAPAPRPSGGNIGQFLASGGGGGGKPKKAREDHTAERALRDANQFDQEIRRANIDILNAKRDLATDAIEQYAISIQIKDSERAAYQAQLAYEVKLNELSEGQDGITQAQADQLQAQYDIKDSLERQKLIADEQQRAFEESAKLDITTLELERDRLQSEAQLADTSKEQRDIQLRILDISYQIERARLQTVLADKQASEAAKEDARRRLAALNRTEGNDRESVRRGTRGPLEDYFSQLPMDADKYNEALESVAANGLKSLEDGLVDVLTGTKNLKEAFHEMAAQMLADLLRLAIQKYVIGSIMKAVGITGGFADGGLVPGFAYGGFVSGPGGPRADRVPAMLSNGEFVVNAKATKTFLPLLEKINSGAAHMAAGGLSIPRTSYGSRVGVSNDNAAGMPRMEFTFHNDFRGADPASVAAIQARQDRFEAELPGRVVRTMHDARERFVWRDKR